MPMPCPPCHHVRMKPPFILCLLDSEEIRLFQTLLSLESSIEAIDVSNGEYKAFDSSGQVLDLAVDEFGAPHAIPSEQIRHDELRNWILRAYSSSPSVALSTDLEGAIDALKAIYRYS